MYPWSTFASRIHSYLRKKSAGEGGIYPWEGVREGTHKEYPRFPRIPLPIPGPLSLPLHEALRRRASCVEHLTGRPFSLQELGTLLGNALGMRGDVRRNYPSGGALFPIETYLIGTVLEGHPSGVFHYHPKAHVLEFLWETPSSFEMAEMFRAAHSSLAPVLMVFTAVWSRSGAKYGDFSYYLGLLEAGHMAQNILLAATALGMGNRPIGGYRDDTVGEILDLDERIEQPVYSVALSPPIWT